MNSEKENRTDISDALALAQDAARNCACLKARKLARQVTRDYDAALRDSGLKITQFTMLAAVVVAGNSVSLTELAERLGMDRSTFSRNLKPLVRRGLVEHSEALKGRSRTVIATEAGVSVFANSAPAWRVAQDRLLNKLAAADCRGFLDDIRAVNNQLAA